MSHTKSLVLLAGAALSLGGVNAALAQQTNADEVRAIVAEVLADAETRSSLLQGAATAGHDRGRFFLASSDGNYRLNVGGQIQFRYVLNFSDDDNPITQDDFDSGFQTRRTKLDFTGNIVNPDWTYRVLFSFDRGDGNGILEEAFVGYNFGNGWRARWGQFKLPLLREELVNSARQLAVERSFTNEVFTQDRSQGIELGYETNDWNFKVAFSDGLNSENTDLGSSTGTNFAVAGAAEYAFTGRFEYKFAGDWRHFNDFTAEQGQEFGALLGLAAHWQQSRNTNAPTDVDRDTFQYTADLSLEGDSWNLFGAFIGRYEEFSALGMSDTDTHDFGVVVQGGYRFAPNTEIFARWDAIFPDDDRAGLSNDSYNFLTFGLNQYYAGHAAKASADVVIALDETDDLVGGTLGFLPNTGLGMYGDTDSGEVAVRLQFQLLF